MPADRNEPPLPTSKREGSRQRPEPSGVRFAGVGLEMTGAVALLALGGWWLDGKLGTSPLFILAGVLVGVAGGTYKLYRLGKRYF